MREFPIRRIVKSKKEKNRVIVHTSLLATWRTTVNILHEKSEQLKEWSREIFAFRLNTCNIFERYVESKKSQHHRWILLASRVSHASLLDAILSVHCSEFTWMWLVRGALPFPSNCEVRLSWICGMLGMLRFPHSELKGPTSVLKPLFTEYTIYWSPFNIFSHGYENWV